MIEYLTKTLGAEFSETEYSLPKNMPAYLKFGYKFRKIRAYQTEFLVVEANTFSLSDYKKHSVKIEELTGLNVVASLKSISRYQRKQLIEKKIPFVVDGSQIFIPFLAVCLCEKYEAQVKIGKFSPSEQLIFLYYMYNKEALTATELSAKIGYTVMTVNRAYSSLARRELFHLESDGRKKYLIPNYSSGEMLNKAEEYLINPVVSKSLTGVPGEDALVSGVYALSEKTMLFADEDDLCYAQINDKQSSKESESGEKVEYWCYNPRILSKDNLVDDISLIISLKDSSDERIQLSVQELKEKYGW